MRASGRADRPTGAARPQTGRHDSHQSRTRRQAPDRATAGPRCRAAPRPRPAPRQPLSPGEAGAWPASRLRRSRWRRWQPPGRCRASRTTAATRSGARLAADGATPVRERLGQAAGRARRRAAVRPGGVAPDTLDGPGPAGPDQAAARPPATPGRARQLASLGPRGPEYRPLWCTFLTEQRALLRELGELESAIPSVRAPVLLLADPEDTQVPIGTARRLVQTLPDARLRLV